MSFLRPSFVSFARGFGAAALVLGAVSAQTQVPNRPPAQQVPHIQGDWSCGNVYYVDDTNGGNNNNNGSLATPWRTVTHAVTQALSQTPTGTPITINVKAGLYTAGETFPIRLPARGIKLQAFEPNVEIRGQQSSGAVLLVDRKGPLNGACGFTPDTVIRGLTLRLGNIGVEIDTTLSDPDPATTPDRVIIQRCKILNNAFRGILVNTEEERRSQHVIEENEIAHNWTPVGGGAGIRVRGEGDSSCLIRANFIHNNEVGIEITGGTPQVQRYRPRIASNIVRDSEWGIYLEACSSYLVNNTQGFGHAFSNAVPPVDVIGVYLNGPGDHVVANNIMWNPDNHASIVVPAGSVIDYFDALATGTITKVTNYILDENGPTPPGFVATPTTTLNGDLHLLPTSPLLEIGTNSFVLPVINITAGSLSVRADVGMDFDGDSRVLDTNRDSSARVEIGADELTGGANVRLSSASVDALGNVHTGGVATTIGLVLTTVPSDFCIVYLWNPNGADQIDKNTFVDPYGNWRIETNVPIGNGFASGTGVFTINLTLDPAVLGLERQVYVQALSTNLSHSLGTITNRLMLEVNL